MSEPAQSQSRPPESLSHRTARGLAWMLTQSLLVKLLNIGGQIALAWYLVEEDFGLVVIVNMLSLAPSMVQSLGLRQVMIQRQQAFNRWITAAFWLWMILGLLGGLLMAAIAPLAATWYAEPRLTGLALIVALQIPLEALTDPPLARAHAQMRFKLVASVEIARGIIVVCGSVILAQQGFGAFSLFIPRPAAALVLAAWLWLRAPPRLRRGCHLRRWPSLLRDGALVVLGAGCDLLLLYMGYLVLSVMYEPAVVGLYFFAFSLAQQALALITGHLTNVLLPALSSLQDQPWRQVNAFLRAMRVLACFALPFSLLQAALADPGVRLVFPERWQPAIILIQVLSVGVAFRAIGWPAISLLQAQGRFATRLQLSLISSAVLAAFTVIGAVKWSALGAAIATALHMLVFEPVMIYAAIRPVLRGRSGWREIARTLAAPLAIAALTVGPAYLAGLLIPGWDGKTEHLCRFLAVALLAVALFVALCRRLAPDAWEESASRVRQLVSRR